MSKKYKVLEILHRDGTPRTDKFYPELIGKVMICPYGKPEIGWVIYGEIDGKHIRTSIVEDVLEDTTTVTVITRNTIYKLEKV